MLSDKQLIDLLFRSISNGKMKRFSVAADIGVVPETISRWRKTERLSQTNRDQIAIWLAAHGVDIEKEEARQRGEPDELTDGALSDLLSIWPRLAQSEKARVLAYASELLEKSGHVVHGEVLGKSG